MAAEIQERVSFLEETLNRFILHTDKALFQLSTEMKDFKDEMKDFKDEMKDFKDEMKDFKDTMNKKWGDLSNQLGTLVEDFVIPSIPTIFKQLTGLEDLDRVAPRIKVRHSKNPKIRKEFDTVAIAGGFILINETKSKPTTKDVQNFAAGLKEVFGFFPEHKDKKILPVFASLYIPEDLVKLLTRRKIFALGLRDDTMQILNPKLKLP